jgi:hypothetical protein
MLQILADAKDCERKNNRRRRKILICLSPAAAAWQIDSRDMR